MFNVLDTRFKSSVSDLVLRTSVTFSGSFNLLSSHFAVELVYILTFGMFNPLKHSGNYMYHLI
jgi:hypothetical protein